MRRGELVWEQVVVLIVIAAAALVLFTWWFNAQRTLLDDKEIDACRISVTGYAKGWIDLAVAPLADAHLVDIDCMRRVITFTEDHVELNGKQARFYDRDAGRNKRSYSELTPEIVNSVAAAEMAICWYEFLEGQSYWTNEVDIGSNDHSCFVCAELHFDADVRASGYTPAPLFEYLRERESRPYPRGLPGEAKPVFHEYLYMSERLCNHDRNWPGDTWYERYLERFPGASCEEAFYHFITVEQGWQDEAIELAADKSYRVLFLQHGRDMGKTKEEDPTGTSYAPLIVPASEFDRELCGAFLG